MNELSWLAMYWQSLLTSTAFAVACGQIQGRKLVFKNADLVKGGLSKKDLEALENTHLKFKESSWKCTYYFLAELLALAVTYDEPWFTDTRMFWLGPGDQSWPDQKMK